MDLAVNFFDGNALHGLLEDASDDILVKVDTSGFIVHASSNFEQLGEGLASQLVMPHLCDLCEIDHSEVVSVYAQNVLGGQTVGGTIEFPVPLCHGSDIESSSVSRRWFSLSLRPIFKGESASLPDLIDPPSGSWSVEASGDGDIVGAIGLLRCVQRVRLLESELHSRAVRDPLTGLSNRHAFSASLGRQLANHRPQMVVVFAVDRMRSLLLQYGQRTADEIQWGFAKFLETMIQPSYELAQLDNERFGVMAPDISFPEAREWAQDVLDTFSSLAITTSPRLPKLGASAGLARLESTVDWTLRQAELALVIARAGGGKQVGQCTYQSAPIDRRGDD
ncbi:MAG: GGDEF domain-containing protein [Pseudomonadota bacterium]